MMTLDQTLEYIHSNYWNGGTFGLGRVTKLLELLGNPQKGLKFVHIAGTNGKGSTAAMTASILRKAGYTVGLYTSPYIYRFNERMQINGEQIPDEELVEITSWVKPMADSMEESPTEFELVTCIAMEYFMRGGCDIVVLEAGENYIDSVFHVEGNEEVIGFALPVGSSPYYERGQERKPLVYMDGQATFKFAVNAIVKDCNTLVQRNGLTYADIAYIVPHQANMRIIDFAGRKLKVPMEKFCVNIDKYGNTSSASIPIALDELNRAGKLKRGDYLLLPAFGGGLASAACLLKW